MYNEESFLEIGLHVVYLPAEMENGQLTYQVFLKELPQFLGAGASKQAALMQLTEKYLAYREKVLADQALEQEETEEEKTMQLAIDELLRYYDGETFDGFQLSDKE